MFGNEVNNIIKNFYKDNKMMINLYILILVCIYLIESIFLPDIMSKFMSSVDLKKDMTKLLIILIIYQLIFYLSKLLNSKIEPLLKKYITDIVIEKIFIKYNYEHKKINSTVIFQDIDSLTSIINNLINKIFFTIMPKLICIIIIIYFFSVKNKTIAFIIFILIFIQLCIMYKENIKCIKINEIKSKNINDNINKIVDKLDNIHIINSIHNKIDKEIIESKIITQDTVNIINTSEKCLNNKQKNNNILNTFVFSIILLYVYKLHNNNKIDIKSVTTLMISINSLFNYSYDVNYYIYDVIKDYGELKEKRKLIDNLFKYKKNDTISNYIIGGNINVNNLSFGYNDKLLIKNLSLNINKGDIVGIYGESGSGKTSLIKLLMNFEDLKFGEIKIDSINVKNISHNEITKKISYVNQESNSLFNTTIYNNLIYGNENIKNINNIIKDIFIDYELMDIFGDNNFDFFNRYVGKHGELLSGGQKQIIHIIRSIINKNILISIYDEPTSAIDEINKNKIINLIKNKNKDNIVFIISHDENIKTICNKIITLIKS